MPGPVSDSYDPEFGTGANAQDVADALTGVLDQISSLLGPDRKYIVGIAHSDNGPVLPLQLSERGWRLVRFALDRELESF